MGHGARGRRVEQVAGGGRPPQAGLPREQSQPKTVFAPRRGAETSVSCALLVVSNVFNETFVCLPVGSSHPAGVRKTNEIIVSFPGWTLKNASTPGYERRAPPGHARPPQMSKLQGRDMSRPTPTRHAASLRPVKCPNAKAVPPGQHSPLRGLASPAWRD